MHLSYSIDSRVTLLGILSYSCDSQCRVSGINICYPGSSMARRFGCLPYRYFNVLLFYLTICELDSDTDSNNSAISVF